ncbi:MAG: hypothetical protein Q8P58_02690 [Candidatus Adlerbacteria bacterium]|nr:hypothetical protein [Candidatus Adlerbacteria bacterium]
MIFRPSLVTATLPVAIALQYIVSFLHHWLPYSEMRSKLDRSVISLVIGATYVPYWGSLLPVQEAVQRLPWVGLATLIGFSLVLTSAPDRLVGLFWAVFASAGLIISFWELQMWLPPVALALFWLGSSLYGVQQLVYALRYPDPLPELFGYREVQHLVLFVATIIGSIIALQYT